MPRGPRLDAPGALHHVWARGIEKRLIFLDDADREDLLGRLGRVIEAGALDVYAWALMPNHLHLLVRTGAWPLHRAMRALLAGYATRFNRRHERAGHLFQNRYKSTLCEDEPYFLTLVQYIHLNPVPSVVPDVAALSDYPYTGHSVLLGRTQRRWQGTTPVLERFAADPVRARVLYEDFVRHAAGQERADLEGGGLVRSVGGWQHVCELRRGREKFTSDERILGGSHFVEKTLADLKGPRGGSLTLDDVIGLVCQELGVDPGALTRRGGPRAVSRARGGIAYLWNVCLGRSGPELTTRIALRSPSVYEAARRGEADAAFWLTLFRDGAENHKTIKRPPTDNATRRRAEK